MPLMHGFQNLLMEVPLEIPHSMVFISTFFSADKISIHYCSPLVLCSLFSSNHSLSPSLSLSFTLSLSPSLSHRPHWCVWKSNNNMCLDCWNPSLPEILTAPLVPHPLHSQIFPWPWKKMQLALFSLFALPLPSSLGIFSGLLRHHHSSQIIISNIF